MSQARILNKSIAGRAIPILASVTPIHELENKWKRDTIEMTVFNSASASRVVEVHYNGVLAKFTVPANDKVEIGPIAIWGQAGDGTEISNKNLSLKAANIDEISVMGRVSE